MKAKIKASELRNFVKGKPRVHGNGFIQLDLNVDNYRLHFWTKDNRIKRQEVSTDIHNHNFSFISRILYGELINYCLKHSLTSHEKSFSTAYNFYTPEQRKDQDTVLKKASDSLYYFETVFSSKLKAESEYFLQKGNFHWTEFKKDAITLMRKTEIDYAEKVFVACPFNQIPDNDFTRYDNDEKLLWEIIDNMIKHIDSFEI